MPEFPPDLPHVLHYRLPSAVRCKGAMYDSGITVRVALPRTSVQFLGSSGISNAQQVCPTIPPGADAWRVPGGDWQPMNTIPLAWKPFLERQRGSEMDPRK
jgi:hypothetical protein